MGIEKNRLDRLLELLKDKQRSRVLDIGCRTGYWCHRLSEIGHDPYGVEVRKEAVRVAREKYPQLHFEVGNCQEKIPFDDKFFDIVWAGDVIEHIAFTDTFVNEINRVLRIDGLFILTTPMHNRLKNILISICNFERHFDPEFAHLRFYTLKSLRNVLEKRGFRTKSVKYLGRIKPVAKSMCVIAEKVEDKQVYSKHRY